MLFTVVAVSLLILRLRLNLICRKIGQPVVANSCVAESVGVLQCFLSPFSRFSHAALARHLWAVAAVSVVFFLSWTAIIYVFFCF